MSAPRHAKASGNDRAWSERLTAALIAAVLRALSWMPLRVNQSLGRGVGYLLWWLPNSNKRITLQNLAVAYPHMSTRERARLAKQSLLHLGQAVTELGPVWCWPQKKLLAKVVEVRGRHLLEEALSQDKGALFLTPHMGCWELNAVYLAALSPSTFLYQPPHVASLEAVMHQARSRFGAQLVPTDMRGVRSLIQALKHGEVSGILPDQDPGARGSVYAPFFGHPARTMTLVSKLLQKSGASCLYMVMERLPAAQGYRLHVLPVDTGGLASDDELAAAQALNAGAEACIGLAPEQYLWSYKRYRKPPPGVADIYKQPLPESR